MSSGKREYQYNNDFNYDIENQYYEDEDCYEDSSNNYEIDDGLTGANIEFGDDECDHPAETILPVVANGYNWGNATNDEPFKDNYEAKALLERVAKGETKAKDEFFRRFAIFVRRKVTNYLGDKNKAKFEDAYNDAWIAILGAAKNYDPEKASAPQYFDIYIKGACTETKNAAFGYNSKNIRKIIKVSNALSYLRNELKAEPSVLEVATYLGWKYRTTYQAMQDMNRTFIGTEESNNEFGETESAEATYFEANEKYSELYTALDRLPELEKEIVMRKYGICGRSYQTEAEMAKELKLSVLEVSGFYQRALLMLQSSNALGRKKDDKKDEITKQLAFEEIAIVPIDNAISIMDVLDFEDL